jgi:hypothetical protein
MLQIVHEVVAHQTHDKIPSIAVTSRLTSSSLSMQVFLIASRLYGTATKDKEVASMLVRPSVALTGRGRHRASRLQLQHQDTFRAILTTFLLEHIRDISRNLANS